MERGPAGQAASTDIATRLGALAEADLLALRLAAQVLGHKAGLVGRPAVVGWFIDLEQAVKLEMARRGIGFVLGRTSEPRLPPDAEVEDRQLLDEHLGLLSGNDQLSDAVRAFCNALREALA